MSIALQAARPAGPAQPAGPVPPTGRVAAREAFYIPSLDGLRAVAVMNVFAAHSGMPIPIPGNFGVTIFFFLSGYLITTLLLREEDRVGRVDFRAFYIRRTFRIYPLYLGVVVLYCVLILGLGMEAARRGLWVENLPYIVWFPEHLPYFRTTDVYPPFRFGP